MWFSLYQMTASCIAVIPMIEYSVTTHGKESILADYDDGMTMREIAPKYGITFQRVGQIIKDEKEKGWVTKRPVYIPKVKIKKVRPRRRTIEDKLFRMYQELREKKPKATQAQIATLIAEELGRPIPSVNAMISAARIKRGEESAQ